MRYAWLCLSSAIVVAACSQQLPNQQAPRGGDEATEVFQLPPDPFGWPIVGATNLRVGTVFTKLEKQGTIRIRLDVANVPPGAHGVRIHEIAKCDPPGFETAGPQWNWTGKKHGRKGSKGYQAGNLGNLNVTPDGKGEATFVIDEKGWDPKQKGPLSIVIHEATDDEVTDANGSSGKRIACGTFYLRRD